MLDKIRVFAKKNKLTQCIIYIAYRIFIAFEYFCFFIFSVKPIDEKKIVVCSIKGRKIDDNIRNVTNELLNRGYNIVCLLRNDVNVEMPNGVKRVDYSFLHNAYELATAKIWIDSNFKFAGFRKRKNQLYIQTWHGSIPIKKIGFDLKDKLSLIDKIDIRKNSAGIDLWISNSKISNEVFRNAFLYKGKLFEVGSPRNDIFFRLSEKESAIIREKLGVLGCKIALYAPTFRDDYRTENFKIDIEKLRFELSKKFGGDWVILIRLHPFVSKYSDCLYDYSEIVKNVSDYPSMQELLVISDLLITDYSSCMFDFALTKKPCILFATDIKEYVNERGFYFNIRELPFPLAADDDELSEAISSFNDIEYRENVLKFIESIELHEEGTASEVVADYIEKYMD